VNEAKLRPELGLAQVAAIVMEGYADRPALAQRASELVTDPVTGRKSRQLLGTFETVSYRELWSRARALANVWHHETVKPLRSEEFLCILAFAGIDYATVDLAGIFSGVIAVPMQTNAPIQQLIDIVKETEPRWIATSLECLDTAVELVISGFRPVGLVVFDYHPEVDDEREVFDAAVNKLMAAGLPDLLDTLPALCARGATLPAAPLYAKPDTHNRLCTIYYTSGSTGSPKGAMYPERLVKTVWRAPSPRASLTVHYMPMNHAFGRSTVFLTLSSGGTCYFTAKSDLSALFEDIRIVRPTQISAVPRICEMLYQLYQVEVERRASDSADPAALKHEIMREIRQTTLGGRVIACSFGSAPLTTDLRDFMVACLGIPLDENYGCTELQAVTFNNRIVPDFIRAYKLDDVPELGYFKTDKPYPRGELRVQSKNMMLGYYKRPELSASMFDEEGYYKTGDIMAEIGPDQLIYVDRRNNVLKLAQGEFVAISRLESLYTNGHPVIRQVFLYGTSERSYLIGVIVPNEATLKLMDIVGDEKAIKATLREAIKEIARMAELNAYEVPRDFIVEHEPFSAENGLLAGIGKYQRPKFKERYAARLERLYDEIAANRTNELQGLRREGRRAPVLETVMHAVQATLGVEDIDLSKSTSFIDLGGDSLSALSCSILLEEIYEIEVPAGVINNPAGSLQQLARFIQRARDSSFKRPSFASVHGRGATDIHASDLKLEKFIDAQTLERARKLAPASREIRTVLVTGANGYLGRFLCLEWLERMARIGGGWVICVARGQDAAAARQRIADAFDSGDPELSQRFAVLADKHLEVLAGDLGEPDLGLNHADWQRLARTVDLVVHPAAFVNHVLPYAQLFGANVVGTAELIRLAITDRMKLFNNVSTVAAAMVPGGGTIDEDADVRIATPVRRLDPEGYANGYANSKWAGEVLLREAHERFSLPVAVFRSDMILAHSQYKGQINVPDMFTRWLLSIVVTGLAPRSFYAGGTGQPHYDGLPVDFTAEAIATLGANCHRGYRTYHVVNPHQDGISMDSFVDWAIEAGHPIRRIDDYAEWFGRFEMALRGLPEKQRQQSSLPLLHQMRRPMPAAAGASVSASRFRADVRTLGVGADKDIPRLSVAFICKYLDDLRLLRLIGSPAACSRLESERMEPQRGTDVDLQLSGNLEEQWQAIRKR